MTGGKPDLAFLSMVLSEQGGGAKTCALRARSLRHCVPRFLSTTVPPEFFSAYGLGPVGRHRLSYRHNPADPLSGDYDQAGITQGLSGADALVIMTGLASNVNEYRVPWAAARGAGIVRVLDTVFNVGDLSHARDAALVLAQSLDTMRDVHPSDVGPVLALPLPVSVKAAPLGAGAAVRDSVSIPQGAFVVGAPCEDAGYTARDLGPAVASLGTEVYLLTTSPDLAAQCPRFRRTGHLVQAEMPAFYAACDVVAHVRPESFGYNVLDAVALGRPCLYLWSGVRDAPAEFLDRGGGYIARDPGGLREALLHMMAHPQEAAARAAVGQARLLAECAPEVSVRRLEGLLLWAMAEAGRAPYELHAGYDDVWAWRAGQRGRWDAWRAQRAEIERTLQERSYL